MSNVKDIEKQEAAVVVKDLFKSFKLPHEQSSGLKQALIGLVGGKKKKGYELQQVLDGISFEIQKGEFFGIVGRNGSGKSTLLKLLSGIYTPDSGLVQVNGSLTPFIELGVGFNPELTGRENVFLNGALLGFSQKEMEEMYEDIVQFAELERFMDQKLKNYSSGMQVRLAFSIAIRADTDILILDEVLAVGDEAFQQKCNDYFERLKKEKKTIILVTHDMNSVERYCNRALLLDKGRLKEIGKPADISRQYSIDNFESAPVEVQEEPEVSSVNLTSAVKSLEVSVVSEARLGSDDNFVFDIEYELKKDLPVYLAFSLAFREVSVAEHNSRSIELGHEVGVKYRVRYSLQLDDFNTTELKLSVAIFSEKTEKPIGHLADAGDLVVKSNDRTKAGPMLVNGTWSRN